jgi:hypothetical protein
MEQDEALTAHAEALVANLGLAGDDRFVGAWGAQITRLRFLAGSTMCCAPSKASRSPPNTTSTALTASAAENTSRKRKPAGLSARWGCPVTSFPSPVLRGARKVGARARAPQDDLLPHPRRHSPRQGAAIRSAEPAALSPRGGGLACPGGHSPPLPPPPPLHSTSLASWRMCA